MVFDLRGPNGTPTGDAARFIAALNTARHISSGIDTNASIVRLTFDDGQAGAASDFEDVPIGLYNCLTYYFEIPHTGWLHAVALVYATEPPFELEVAYEGMDGPLMVRFLMGPSSRQRSVQCRVANPQRIGSQLLRREPLNARLRPWSPSRFLRR